KQRKEQIMVTPAVNTIIKMIEQLPEPDQEKVAEHIREYLAELEDEDNGLRLTYYKKEIPR
ncbi:MAG TPA: hypothetical protein VI524_06095, partial [Anaerolineales bacterium]|nr:hypothetical protein [Anaerolineales bacterium]